MGDKVKRYGWRRILTAGETQTSEFDTKIARDSASLGGGGWRKYTVTRTVRANGKPLWWAIRQMQEGRAVVDAHGARWKPDRLGSLLALVGGCVTGLPDLAQSWTLAEVGS